MEHNEWANLVTTGSTQVDPSQPVRRDILREHAYRQVSGTTQPEPVFVEDVAFRGEFRALVKQVEDLRNRITTNAVTIDSLANDNWELKDSLNVTVEQKGQDEFIACLYDADVYGYGDTVPGALEDLKEALVNQLEFLLEEAKTVELGVIPRKQLNFLQRIITAIHA